MLTIKQQKLLEADIGSLDLLPPAVRLELERAFIKALAIQERIKDVEARYGYPVTAKKAKSETEKQYQKRKARDESHYQHPKNKMERYRYARHIHLGNVPYLKCTCFRNDTNSTPCPFVPDIKLGGIVEQLPHWWRHRYSLEHGKK